MSENRIVKQVYIMINKLDGVGRKNWVSQRRFLLKERFEYVWLQQGVENDQLFLEIFQSRVKELFYDKLRHRVENSSKLSIYSTF